MHHLSPLAVVGRDINEDAYGCIEVFDDKLKLEMVGAHPDVAKLPAGWPSELYLPRGGAIVPAGDGAGLGFFISFFFFMLNMVSLPLQPVVRMLTSNEEDLGSLPILDSEGILPSAEDIAAHAAATQAATTVTVGSDGPQQPAAAAPQLQKSEASSASGAPAADEPGVIV